MQFIRNGPEIPERLLQAHEDGRVVFFCGAGVSFPARLPSFSGLVEKLYSSLSVAPSTVQAAAIKAKQFDTAIGLLEADIMDGRETVRRAMAEILEPDLSAPHATSTHEALLILGKNREGRTRLITTNFDRLFEEVIAAKELAVTNYEAPLLPVPKSRWDGLVYLHGLLHTSPTADQLDCLVVSSGDFGLAYLTERWAARFVSELFREYNVCFVGYSINDPVLRYMMDALAADRLLGESPPEMFAFGSYSKGKEEAQANEWRAKNVTPILYKEHNRHAYLHKTLRTWAETYRDGVRGKERIIVEHGIARPMASTKQDDFVGRLLWAISDPTGLPAKRFADLDPVPPLDWLELFFDERYRHSDLRRFGIPPTSNVDEELTFSLLRRPSPYPMAPKMSVVDAGAHRSRWDDVMRHLARWLIRHLDDPNLLLWLVNRGPQLHDDFIRLIEHRLDELDKLTDSNNTEELTRIRAGSPKAIPRPTMRKLWRLVLTGRVQSFRRSFDLFSWRDRFKSDGLTTTLRLDLRDMLTPRVVLRAPFSRSSEEQTEKEVRIKDLVDWEIVLSTDHVHSNFQELSNERRWKSVLPELLFDATALLCDTLDLMRELGGADEKSDLSYIVQPSISDHPQNQDFRDWTALIDLARDSWLATAKRTPEQAVLMAETWSSMSYPLFRRLAFFAAAHQSLIPVRRSLDWLLTDDHWWLWSVETEREVMRLLVALAPKIDEPMRIELELAILNGPPRDMFNRDVEPAEWSRIVDREIWLRLAKLAETGTSLGPSASEKLAELSGKYPQWNLAADQNEEFPFWMDDGDEWRKFVPSPRRRPDLIEWLKRQPKADYWQDDDWRQRCRDDFATTACALCALAKENHWPTDRWGEALQAWSEEKHLKRSWRYMAPILTSAPRPVLQSLAYPVGQWLKAISTVFEGHEECFFTLNRGILNLELRDNDSIGEPVGRAINHPVGFVTQALLHWWYRRSPEDGQRLPEEIRPTFTELCNTKIEKFRHGRVLLAAHVISLFRVDQDWAKQYLLPNFEWERCPEEARAAWAGFLWSPRLYRPLMETLKPAFLDTANHYAALGQHEDRQFASILTFASLDPGETFTKAELANATRALPPDGLLNAAQALVRALEGAGEQGVDYWTNRVLPYLHSIWPKSRANVSPEISETLSRLCVAAQDAFPEATTKLKSWLQPQTEPHYAVTKLHEAGHCKKFPEPALDFLSSIIGDKTQWAPRHLAECLEGISTSEPELANDQRYEKLMEHQRRYGS